MPRYRDAHRERAIHHLKSTCEPIPRLRRLLISRCRTGNFPAEPYAALYTPTSHGVARVRVQASSYCIAVTDVGFTTVLFSFSLFSFCASTSLAASCCPSLESEPFFFFATSACACFCRRAVSFLKLAGREVQTGSRASAKVFVGSFGTRFHYAWKYVRRRIDCKARHTRTRVCAGNNLVIRIARKGILEGVSRRPEDEVTFPKSARCAFPSGELEKQAETMPPHQAFVTTPTVHTHIVSLLYFSCSSPLRIFSAFLPANLYDCVHGLCEARFWKYKTASITIEMRF